MRKASNHRSFPLEQISSRKPQATHPSSHAHACLHAHKPARMTRVLAFPPSPFPNVPATLLVRGEDEAHLRCLGSLRLAHS